jgi:hypothetical protein
MNVDRAEAASDRVGCDLLRHTVRSESVPEFGKRHVLEIFSYVVALGRVQLLESKTRRSNVRGTSYVGLTRSSNISCTVRKTFHAVTTSLDSEASMVVAVVVVG